MVDSFLITRLEINSKTRCLHVVWLVDIFQEHQLNSRTFSGFTGFWEMSTTATSFHTNLFAFFLNKIYARRIMYVSNSINRQTQIQADTHTHRQAHMQTYNQPSLTVELAVSTYYTNTSHTARHLWHQFTCNCTAHVEADQHGLTTQQLINNRPTSALVTQTGDSCWNTTLKCLFHTNKYTLINHTHRHMSSLQVIYHLHRVSEKNIHSYCWL